MLLDLEVKIKKGENYKKLLPKVKNNDILNIRNNKRSITKMTNLKTVEAVYIYIYILKDLIKWNYASTVKNLCFLGVSKEHVFRF